MIGHSEYVPEQPDEPGEWRESTFSALRPYDLVRRDLTFRSVTFICLLISRDFNEDAGLINVEIEEWYPGLTIGDGHRKEEKLSADGKCFIWTVLLPVTPEQALEAKVRLQELI